MKRNSFRNRKSGMNPTQPHSFLPSFTHPFRPENKMKKEEEEERMRRCAAQPRKVLQAEKEK